MNDLVVATRPYPLPTLTIGEAVEKASDWSSRYGDKHRMHPITNWPAGIEPPTKVRIYLRNRHFFLQWWEPSARKNQAERVDGDLVTAVARAREIEQRLLAFKNSGRVGGRIGQAELVARFMTDLNARADAGEVEPRSVRRFGSALNHYLAFVATNEIARRYPYAAGVNRAFALGFASFLDRRTVSPNGSSNDR